MRMDRYVVREMIVPFLIGTLVIVMMFQANAYIAIAKTYNIENVPLVARFQWIMYQTPSYLRMTLPVGTSLAAALTMTRLARDSELTALRTAGARIVRVITPVVFAGILVSVANFYIVDRVIPISSRKANDIERKNAFLGMSALFKSNAFVQIGQFAASLGTVSREPNDALTITNIVFFDRSDRQHPVVVSADSGRYQNGVWTFTNGYYYQLSGLDLVVAKPWSAVIDQQLNIDQLMAGMEGFSVEEQPTAELRKDIQAAIASHGNPRPAQIELDERYAVPASCAVFAITSAVFAIFFARSGGFAGVLVSFLIVLLYYNAFVISTQILGKIDAVPPWLAAWLPNIVFGVLGVIWLRRLE